MTRHLLRKSSYTLDENESEISCTQARLRRSGREVKFFDQGLLELKYVYSTRLIHSHGMVAIALNMLRSVQYCTSTCNSMSTLCNKKTKNIPRTCNMEHLTYPYQGTVVSAKSSGLTGPHGQCNSLFNGCMTLVTRMPTSQPL